MTSPALTQTTSPQTVSAEAADPGSQPAQKSSTHHEYVSPGYSVTIQHCEHPGCDAYLGVNYPSIWCDEHRPPVRRSAPPSQA